MQLGLTRSDFLPARLEGSKRAVAISLGVAIYLVLVRLLRFQRVRSLRRKYGDGPPVNTSASDKKNRPVAGRPDVRLTPEEAQEIVRRVAQLEMPGLMRFSLVFALFKTYAIPTISEILLQSKQLSTPDNVSKRFADTGILISTWTSCPLIDFTRMNLKEEEVDSRHAIAIARTNWLHNRWPNIKNEDYIYTMSLFVLEPARWAQLYGWRELLPIEREAYFVLWKEIGRRMNIRDIPETLQDLIEWSETYEETAMVPAISNYKVGQYTLDYMLSLVTEWFGARKLMRQVSLCLLEPRVRTAFILPEPSPVMVTITRIFMSFFAIRARYFELPRFKRKEFIPRKIPAEKFKEKMPRFYPAIFGKVPWYKPEPKGISRIWQNILVKIGYLDKKYIPSPKYKSEGYRLEECGPISVEQDGHAEVMNMAAEIQRCPVTGIWAR
ncbi:hypothetical protein ACEPAI_2272 [Sanghuangporus weigelae]